LRFSDKTKIVIGILRIGDLWGSLDGSRVASLALYAADDAEFRDLDCFFRSRADGIGYRDVFFFSRQFKQRFGVSPTTRRARLQAFVSKRLLLIPAATASSADRRECPGARRR
jgi:hypothetical protein